MISEFVTDTLPVDTVSKRHVGVSIQDLSTIVLVIYKEAKIAGPVTQVGYLAYRQLIWGREKLEIHVVKGPSVSSDCFKDIGKLSVVVTEMGTAVLSCNVVTVVLHDLDQLLDHLFWGQGLADALFVEV